MMIVIHDVTYNPRIDFLVCKNILSNLPFGYDELKLRKCFWEEGTPSESYEKTIIEIKKYFENNDLKSFTTQNIYELYSVITKESVNESSSLITNMGGVEEIVNLANLVENTFVANKSLLFQLAMLVNYLPRKGVPLIPYHSTCKHLYYSALREDIKSIKHLLDRLIMKLDHYCHKHTLQDNEQAVECLYHNANSFLQTMAAQRLCFYGSLAVGSGNEYSDLDILVIFPDGTDLLKMERKAKMFWIKKIQIPFDILVTTESDFDVRTTKGMKATMKVVEGQ